MILALESIVNSEIKKLLSEASLQNWFWQKPEGLIPNVLIGFFDGLILFNWLLLISCRGDKAFCSLECREVEIKFNEELEKSKTESENSPKAEFGVNLFEPTM